MRRCSTGGDKRQGTTLIELIVCSCLFGVVLYCVYALMNSGARNVKRAEALLELQQDALGGLAWINREASESNEDGFKVEPTGLIYASPRDMNNKLLMDPTGPMMWQKIACFYLGTIDGTPSLLYKQKALVPPEQEIPNLPALTVLVNDSSVPHRVVARHVVAITGDSNPQPPQELGLTLRLEELGKNYEIRVKTSVFFRN